MSFKIKVPVQFKCDRGYCGKTADGVSDLKIETTCDTDSYGRSTYHHTLTVCDLPPGWVQHIFYGSVSHYCEEHA